MSSSDKNTFIAFFCFLLACPPGFAIQSEASCSGTLGKPFSIGFYVIVEHKLAQSLTSSSANSMVHALIYLAKRDWFQINVRLELLGVSLSQPNRFHADEKQWWIEIAKQERRRYFLPFPENVTFFYLFIISDKQTKSPPLVTSSHPCDGTVVEIVIQHRTTFYKMIASFYYSLASLLGIKAPNQAECLFGNCFLYPSNQWRRWSNCTVDDLKRRREGKMLSCFPEHYRVIKWSVCGDRRIDGEEQCECAFNDITCNGTCDYYNCMLKNPLATIPRPVTVPGCPSTNTPQLKKCLQNKLCLSGPVKTALLGVATIVIVTGLIAMAAGVIMAASTEKSREPRISSGGE